MRNTVFIGRQAELGQIHQDLNHKPAPLCFLSGPSGIGKTQVVLEYAYQQLQAYQSVLWIEAHAADLTTALDRTRFPVAEGSVLSGRQRLEQLLGEEGLHLLVIDDVDHPDEVAALLPKSGALRVLVTTRSPGAALRAITIGPLGEAEALHWFCPKPLPPAERAAVRQLYTMLAPLTLALDVARCVLAIGVRRPTDLLSQVNGGIFPWLVEELTDQCFVDDEHRTILQRCQRDA